MRGISPSQSVLRRLDFRSRDVCLSYFILRSEVLRVGVLRVLAVVVLVIGGHAAACEAPRKVFEDGTVTEQARPRLEWTAVKGASGYRVRLQSRVPNGRVVAASDTVVSTPAYLPPQPLTEQRAKVTVRVKAICARKESAETVSWFLIDTSAMCRLGEVSLEARALRWEPVVGAKAYEVRSYRLEDGRLIASQETRTTEAKLELREGAVVGVRPVCEGGLGEAVYRVVAR